GVQDAEHGCVRTGAEGQRENDDGGELRRRQDRAPRVLQVEDQAVHVTLRRRGTGEGWGIAPARLTARVPCGASEAPAEPPTRRRIRWSAGGFAGAPADSLEREASAERLDMLRRRAGVPAAFAAGNWSGPA